MINKRLLVKNLLAYTNENTFYDKKRQHNLHTKEGKAKFLKHISALSNSNPFNNSYLLVGVEDDTNEMIGEDFFDDSKIQNLVNAYLVNPPKIQYENIPFNHLPKDKVIGLVTIFPNAKVCEFKKNIYTIPAHTIFQRMGSNSIPTSEKIKQNKNNVPIVLSIENNSRNSIKNTLDNVIDFITVKHNQLDSQYQVFKENFVVCWAGQKRKLHDTIYFSRVDVELINEQVKLFYSIYDEVTIEHDESSFIITEYIPLGLNDKTSYYPFEKVYFTFFNNGFYKIENKLIFTPPKYSQLLLEHVYYNTLQVLDKLKRGFYCTEKETLSTPHTLLICYLNGFENAKDQLIEVKTELKNYPNPLAYIYFKESLRILRKMKYGMDK